MANTFKLKTSAVQGKSPLIGDLQTSELAWNSFDGKLYGKKNDGTASIVEIGGGGAAGISSLNTLTGATQTFAVGTSGTDFAISSTGTTHTFNLPDASTTARGLLTTGTQSITGIKTFTAPAAASSPLILKGAASQTAPLLQMQNSAGTQTMRVNVDGTMRILQALGGSNTYFNVSNQFDESIYAVYNNADGGFIYIGTQIYFGVTFGFDKTRRCFRIYPNGENLFFSESLDNGAGKYTLTIARDVGKVCYNFSVGGTGHGFNFVTANTAGGVGIDLAGAPEAKLHVNSTGITRKGIIVRGFASQSANLFEAQNSAGATLAIIDYIGTVHARRFTETANNAFSTSLVPSTGTLTIDSTLGNVVLGALSASVTTWAFTLVPTDNSKVTTITAVLTGNTAYTYGDACSVNGTAISNGVQWSGGVAPTATSGTDIITFIIVKDSAGTIKVFGSGTTNFS